MQLVWVVVAGAALAWLYLAGFHVVLCGRHAPRMSLLLAIVGFIEGTAVVLAFIWLLSEGRIERLTLALIAFGAARAMLDDRVFGGWREDRAADGAAGGRIARPAAAGPFRGVRWPRRAS